MAILAVWLGTWGASVRRQREAEAWVAKNGGGFNYSWEGAANVPAVFNNDYFRDVYSVTLREPSFSDFTPLTTLSEVRRLWLNVGNVADLRPIENFQKLQILTLQVNKDTDLSALQSLPALQYLDLVGGPCDLSPLVGCRSLIYLGLSDHFAANASQIIALKNLKALHLQATFDKVTSAEIRKALLGIEIVR